MTDDRETGQRTHQGSAPVEVSADEAAERARRRARVFGEVLPEATSDDRADDDAALAPGAADDWLRANVPPHHGA